MRHKSFSEDICPIARSLDAIGEWWSLLIIRDASVGVTRFSDFQRRLGLARNVLSTRLKKLVECGIMETTAASDGSAYQEYVLTEKGKALLPVLVTLRQWGERYLFEDSGPQLALVDAKTKKAIPTVKVLSPEGHGYQMEDLALVPTSPVAQKTSRVRRTC